MADKKEKFNLEKIFVGPGVFIFPRLNKPDTKFKTDGEYSVKVKIGSEGGEALKEKLQPIAEKAFEEAKAKIKESLEGLKGAKLVKAKESLEKLALNALPVQPEYDDDGNETGNYIVIAKMPAVKKDKDTGKTTKRRPDIVDSKGKVLENVPLIYGGTEGVVKAFIMPYFNAATATAGASLRLNAVQIIKLVSSGGGDHGFSKVDDGFSGDDLPKNTEKVDDEDTEQAGGEDDDEEF